MRVMTIFGTRPEIIRLSLVMKVLDQHCDHTTVHTGQNYDESLSDIFIRDLEVRQPDVHLGIRSTSFGDQASQILAGIDRVLEEKRPDKILILGDTNSALSSIVAARRRIPIFHMEAGNRCYDDRVPEEINRRLIDHSSTILMPYTERSKENLVKEGIERERIYITGNPINEVLESFSSRIDESEALSRLGIERFGYFLVTLHRSENVDLRERLQGIFTGLSKVASKYQKPIFVSVHPRTASKIKEFETNIDTSLICLVDAMGFFDFVKLEKNALAVLTDSGTVQEECCIFGVPNVTIRDVTERPETIECGSNILSGAEPDAIMSAVDIALAQPANWTPPPEYLATNVANVVSKIVLGYTNIRKYVS
ncbi:MAG: UDP-N-acetylglucosamine 2-epimerase (non-hydrolyzing) [Acidobacteria bacterium]|nr:UDP-N-acetylglucosamine 2-epimerase (non-hydrolyzing) [Acidobacteriota bacterium]